MSLVECYDPDGLYPLLEPSLRGHLPLRNLHWKSPTRPLRSIATLPVDFVLNSQFDSGSHRQSSSQPGAKDAATQSAQSEESANAAQETNSDSRGASTEAPLPGEKSRRHQIPGLRQTPFLKLYLLRCDDNETYKSSSRRLLREWIRDQTPASQSSSSVSKQENHDAFEWLILHVVLPDTAASAQPRVFKHTSSDLDNVKEKGATGSRWPGKSAGSILEKIRADFNQSGKNAPDRVAQVRLSRESVPMHLVFNKPASGPSAPVESSQDKESAWNDLISKFKILILSSFNSRVSQYEDDVREKASQSTLPGWNFCTFFILKEGLIRAFESVGLYEDALAGYDELDVGFDSHIREQSSYGSEEGRATSIQTYTEDLQNQVRAAKSHLWGASSSDAMRNDITRPIGVNNKNYREMIIASNISVFDFYCYLFARQMSLILRLARIHPSHGGTLQTRNGPTFAEILDDNSEPRNAVDPVALGELYRRGISFATATARIMRADLFQGEKEATENAEVARDTIVFSWEYQVVQQILDETLPAYATTTLETRNDHEAPTHPHAENYRASSSQSILNPRKNSHSNEKPKDTLEGYGRSANATNVANVAALRAEMYLLQRSLLQKLGSLFGCDQEGKFEKGSRLLEDQRNGDAEADDKKSAVNHRNHETITSPILRDATSSQENFTAKYEDLSNWIVKDYYAADRRNSAEKILTDLAVLKFHCGDYAAAVGYFTKLVSSFGRRGWNAVELSILRMQATSLKELHRTDDHVRAVLSILARSAEARRYQLRLDSARSLRPQESKPSGLNPNLNVNDLVSDLIDSSMNLPYDVSAPLEKYFGAVQIGTDVEVFSDRDGLGLCLRLQQLFATKLRVTSIRVRLLDATDTQSKEVWFESESALELDRSIRSVYLHSNITTRGQLVLDRIVLRAGKILFKHEALAATNKSAFLTLKETPTVEPDLAIQSTPLLCQARQNSLFAKATKPEVIHIGPSSSFEVHLNTGLNNIQHGQIIIRAASAGLRLRTTECKSLGHEFPISDTSKPGILDFTTLQAETWYRLQIPYDLERSLSAITLRIEVRYNTDVGEFVFLARTDLDITLPLEINVHDIPKSESFISKIWIEAAGLSPIYLLNVDLKDSRFYQARSAMQLCGLPTFPKQPACITYKITRVKQNKVAETSESIATNKLLLTVVYRSVLDDVVEQVSAMFMASLRKSQFSKYREYMYDHFRDRLSTMLSAADLAMVAISGQLSNINVERFHWYEAIKIFEADQHNSLKLWLQEWHEENARINIRTPDDESYRTAYAAQQLKIDFEIPVISYVHTTSIRINQTHEQTLPHTCIVGVGEMLAATVEIQHTRRWDSTSNGDAGPRDFVYDIQTDPTLWLLVGQRRAFFASRADETSKFDILIIPQQTGHLLLPYIDVKPASALGKATKANMDAGHGLAPAVHPAGEDTVRCETNCTTKSKTITVIENARSTTFGLGSRTLPDTMTLLGSSARNTVSTT